MNEISFIEEQNPGNPNFSGKSYRLNMSVLQAFERLGAKDWNELYCKLISLGAKEPFTIMLSEQDVENLDKIYEMRTEDGDYIGPDGLDDFYHEVIQCTINQTYYDVPFEENGKWGLKCTSGKIVVPPLFDECKGALGIDMAHTMAVVKHNGQMWLSPRNSSGNLNTSVGYKSILRSDCYAWVNDGEHMGLLDSRTGQVLIPCEMDWIIDAGVLEGQIIGKGNKVGLFDAFINSMSDSPDNTQLYPPIYDAINLTTGQFCLNGKWGWLLKGGDFTESVPKRIQDAVYVGLPVPLDHDANELLYAYHRQNANQISGVKQIKQLFTTNPSRRLKAPLLKPDDVMVEILPSVAECFSGINDTKVISIPVPHGNPVSVSLSPVNGGKWDLQLSWMDCDQMYIAVSRAFPLIHAFNEIIFSDQGKYCARFELTMKEVDLDLPQKIISALTIIKERMPEVKKTSVLPRVLHVINQKGEHLTIPFNINNSSSDTGKTKYKLDVEWYRNNGHCTLDDLEEKLRGIKMEFEESE